MSQRVWKWIGFLGLACLAWGGPVRAEQKGAEPDKLDLESLLTVSREEVLKTDMEEAGEGDSKPYNITTDDDIATLEVGDVYRNDEKTFFTIGEITSKGSKGGAFVMKRTRGKGEPGRRYTRVTGKGPYVVTQRVTVWDIYKMGGPLMNVISFLAAAAIVMTINCIWVLRRGRQIPPAFLEQARAALEKGNMTRLEELTLQSRGLFPTICRAMAFQFHASTLSQVRSRVEAAASQAVVRLKIPVRALNAIMVAAPLCGLLGTIWGMYIVFEGVAEADSAHRASLLASGIRQKLLCTFWGLCVAIPSLALFFTFNQYFNLLVAKTEGLTEQFMERVAALKSAGAKGAAQEAEEALAVKAHGTVKENGV